MDAKQKVSSDAEKLLRMLTVGDLVRIPNGGTTGTVLNLGELGRGALYHHRVLVSWWDGNRRFEQWLSVVELEVIQ